jgi:hypothetical protein
MKSVMPTWAALLKMSTGVTTSASSTSRARGRLLLGEIAAQLDNFALFGGQGPGVVLGSGHR